MMQLEESTGVISQQGHLACVRVSGPQGWAPGPERGWVAALLPEKGRRPFPSHPSLPQTLGLPQFSPLGAVFILHLQCFSQAHLGP